MGKQQFGVIGLAVMGKNLALNTESKGYSVAVYNRTRAKTDELLKEAEGRKLVPAYSIEEFVALLEKPRKIMLMVKAGAPTDAMIEQLVPHLEEGDIIIDGGNSRYDDSTRRTKTLKEKGILFIGSGISGGEEGARHGPSIMPGGNPDAWPHVKEILQSIAAKVDNGDPCCDWV